MGNSVNICFLEPRAAKLRRPTSILATFSPLARAHPYPHPCIPRYETTQALGETGISGCRSEGYRTVGKRPNDVSWLSPPPLSLEPGGQRRREGDGACTPPSLTGPGGWEPPSPPVVSLLLSHFTLPPTVSPLLRSRVTEVSPTQVGSWAFPTLPHPPRMFQTVPDTSSYVKVRHDSVFKQVMTPPASPDPLPGPRVPSPFPREKRRVERTTLLPDGCGAGATS